MKTEQYLNSRVFGFLFLAANAMGEFDALAVRFGDFAGTVSGAGGSGHNFLRYVRTSWP